MDKEFQDNSMSAVAGPSNDGEAIYYWDIEELDDQTLFRNQLVKIYSNDKNSTESDGDETLQEVNDEENKITQLLFNNASAYDKTANGETLLHAAFKKGCRDVLHFALSNLTPNPANKDDVIHFQIACVTNHYVAVEKFLLRRFDPDTPLTLDDAAYSGLRPVEFAIQNKYYELFETLVKFRSDLYRKNAKGLTPLHMIYYAGLPNNGKSWIKGAFKYGNLKELSNSEDEHGVLHIHLCCIIDELHFIQVYIDNGVNVNNQISLTCPLNPGFTPLHFAVINGCQKVTEFLLENGADPNKQDKEGKAPLHLAAEIMGEFTNNTVQLINIVRILLDYKANPIITDVNGATPLHVSFYKAKTRIFNIVKTLILELRYNWGSINHTDEHGLSLFHIACAKNILIPVWNFMNSGVSVNSRVSSGMYSGYTPLHFSVMLDRHKKQKVVEILLENGAKVNEKEDEFGYTPLGLICEKLQFRSIAKSIPILLEYNASTVIADKKGRTPLHKCFYRADEFGYEIFDTLVESTQWGSDNCTDDQGLSLFHIACATYRVDQVTKFLDSGVKADSCVSSGIYGGFTALHFAVMHNQKEVVEILLKRNVNVNDRAGKSAVTPLHLACEFHCRKFNPKYDCPSNQKDIIQLLLSHGAEVDAKDSCGMTPLLIACTIDNRSQRDWAKMLSPNLATSKDLHYNLSVRLQEVITILISNNADINARTKDQSTVLHIISKYKILQNSETLVKLLLNSGVEVNVIDAAGLTPLHVAVRYGSKNQIISLLNHNADPNIKCNNSGIPLHIATDHIIFKLDETDYFNEKRDTFLILVENGSDVNIRDAHGRVLLHKAMRAHKYFLIDNLLKYGADINMEDSQGNCSVSYLHERQPDRKLWIVLRLIFFHLKWLEALKLPISSKVQSFCDRLYLRYKNNLILSGEYISPKDSYAQCCAELDTLRTVKVDRYTTLYDILKKDPHELIKYVKNIDLVEMATDENVYLKYPLYGYLLKRQIKKGLKRTEITQPADTALRNVLNIDLPDLCCDLVLKHLTDDEIVDLIKAAPVKRKLIRKSCDSSSQNESVRKLPKTVTD